MAIDIKDSNIKNVMDYVSERIEKQHLRGIDLFQAAKEQPGLVVKVSNEIFPEELGQIRKKLVRKSVMASVGFRLFWNTTTGRISAV